MNDFDASAHLKSLCDVPDSAIDIGLAALCLSQACTPVSLEKYKNHLKKLSDAVSSRFQALIDKGGADDMRTRLAALKHILSDEYGYALDVLNTEVLESCDLARVIERRKGQSTPISILYLATARNLGWEIEAISFPQYTLCRMEEKGERLIFDSSDQCAIMTAPELRELAKQMLGPRAELSAAYFESLSNRELLIRMQNPIKSRLIEMGDYKNALRVIEQMREIDPQEYRLLLDAGVLYAKTHQSNHAVKALEGYIVQAPNGRDRNEALQLLHELKSGIVT